MNGPFSHYNCLTYHKLLEKSMKWKIGHPCPSLLFKHIIESPSAIMVMHHRFHSIAKIGHRSEIVSPDERVSFYRNVPWRRVLLFQLSTELLNVP